MDINWDRLRLPSEHLKVFVPTTEKVIDFSDRLMKTPLYLSDEHRNPAWVDMLVAAQFAGPNLYWLYEIGNWQGLCGLMDIWPGWKADILFKIWDKGIWGPTLYRELKDRVESLIKEFRLKRLAIQTPDEYMVKMLKRFGFKTEGRFNSAFKWDGKSYTLHCMRRIEKEGSNE